MRRGRYILLFFILIALGFYYFFNPSQAEFFPTCYFNELTGYYCPGCGGQRALYSFLHFDFIQMFDYNFLFIFVVVIIMYYFTWNFFSKKNFLEDKRFLLAAIVAITSFLIIRNIPVYPFTYFAP